MLNRLKLNKNLFQRKSQFTIRDGIVNLHPSKGTHWALSLKLNTVIFVCVSTTQIDEILSLKVVEMCFF